jgi:type II secretion system protein D
MAMIERMIADLDNATTGTKKLRIFRLENADAEAMARILTDLFQLNIDRTLNVLKPRETGGDDPLADDGMLSTELTTVPDERQQLSITVDSRTNTLLVSGAPTYLDLVEEVVLELDSQEANERETIIYPLKNAVAADVARVIGDFVSQDQQKLIDTIGMEELGSAGRLLEREVTIVGDDKSNTVLVTTSPRYMERIRTIIDELDIDPPQVLIEVLIAEITLDAGDDWGVDAEFRFDLDGTAITGGYGLAAGPVLGTMGVPSLAIAATDFDLMIKALQSQGRLALLSNPSIMAANNETARIQVGQNIRVASATSFDQGSQSTATEEEDIGVILEVTPSINPEGFVRMDIVPTISALTQQTIQINEDFETPIITIRTADTTVTVQDGQTIVLGGLIQDRYERREEKVPLLGDIPLLGELFKSHSERSESTELIIVLTPHVVMSPAAIGRQYADDLTNRQVDALHLPESIRENIREGSLIGSDGLFDAQGNPIDIRTKYDERVEESEADDDDGAGDS